MLVFGINPFILQSLNADKTEVLVLGTPKQRAKISVPSISVNGEIVKILNTPINIYPLTMNVMRL